MPQDLHPASHPDRRTSATPSCTANAESAQQPDRRRRLGRAAGRRHPGSHRSRLPDRATRPSARRAGGV